MDTTGETGSTTARPYVPQDRVSSTSRAPRAWSAVGSLGEGSLDLSGWTVQDDAGATYTFPDGTTLEAGAEVTLRTGSGEDTSTELYWGSGRPIWNNDGDTVIVTNAAGEQVLTEGY